MKLNKYNLLKIFALTYQQTNCVIETINSLFLFNQIDENKKEKLISIYEKTFSIQAIFKELMIDKKVIRYFTFYNNYWSVSDSIQLSIDTVLEQTLFKKEIISAIIYPIILIVLTNLALLFIANFILPQLLLLNQENNYSYLVSIIKMIPLMSFLVSFILFSSILLLIYLIKYRLKSFFKLLNNSLVNKIISPILSFIFAFYLKEAIKNNALDKDVILNLQNHVENKIISKICYEILLKLQAGQSLIEVINEIKYLSNDFKQTIILAKDSANLYQLINDYYHLKSEIYKSRIKHYLSIIIPIIVSFIGIMIVFMYLMIMLPILETSTQL